MTLDSNDPRITAYVFGELSGDEKSQFEAEMRARSELREEVARVRETIDELRHQLSAEPTGALTGRQQREIEAAIGRPAAEVRRDAAEAATRDRAGRVVATRLAIGSLALLLLLGAMILTAPPSRHGGRREMARLQPASSGEPSTLTPDGYLDHVGNSKDETSLAGQAGAQAEKTRMVAEGADARSAVARSAAATAAIRQSVRDAERAGKEVLLVRDQAESSRAKNASSPVVMDPSVSARGRNKNDQDVLGYHLNGGASAAANSATPIAEKPQGYIRSDQGIREFRDQYSGPWNESESFRERFEGESDRGRGPGQGGDKYDLIVENPFRDVLHDPLSTFSIDVDTASYSKVRMYLMQNGVMPRPDAVRIEELVNYFSYDYAPPEDDKPFAARMEIAECPWRPGHRLARIAVKGQEIDRGRRPTSNLVFLLDVSGSMNPANKLPLLLQGMRMLTEQLGENDRVAIVVYAGAAGLVLDSTPGDDKTTILGALDRLHAGGSTAGGEGIRLAYQVALDNFVPDGVNRVILCTDGDFNVGTTGTDELVRMVEQNAKTKVFLSVLGFGMGNHNDSMLEQISNKGNGNYAFIDTPAEARKVLVEQMSGTLVTIAKDVKIQLEFNPKEVAAYRLIGYENRMLSAEDFNDDTKDAGEIGAGHYVTALYELIPAGSDSKVGVADIDELTFQRPAELTEAAERGAALVLKLRYKLPDEDSSTKLEFLIEDEGLKLGQTSKDFRFASAVAAFGMLLRDSAHKGNATYDGVLEIAGEAVGEDPHGYRAEFLEIVRRAKHVSGQ